MDFKKFGLSGVAAILQLGKLGPKVKANAGVIELRNAADSAFAVVRGASPVGDNDLVTKQYLERSANVIVNGQINGGAPPSPADGLVYIVTTAGGGYALGELYRREAGAWVLIALVDGLRVAIADPLTGGTVEYAIGVYLYDLDTTTWVLVGPIAATSKMDKNEIASLAFNTASPLNIGAVVPSGAIIKKVQVNVTQAFDGTAPTLDLGDAGDTDRFMGNAEIDLKTVGLYVSDVHYLYGADTQVIGTYAADSSTVGQAVVLIEFRNP